MKNLSNNEPCPRFNPLNDFLFFKVMGEKGDEVQLLGFLNAVLSRSGKERIESIEIMEDKSYVKNIADGKSCILDVLAVLSNGTKVNVEVQLGNEYNMDRRSLFYWSKVYSESLDEGQNYRKLPNVIAVNIVGFDYPKGSKLHTCFHLREDTDTSLVLTSALEIHFINMVQWRKHKEKDIQNDPLHRWLVWFDEKSPMELVEEVARMDSAIMAANEKQEYVTQDEETRRSYWSRMKAKLDWSNGLEGAREEGETNKAIEIAQNLKKMGLSVEQIAEGTGLSQEAVERL